MSRDIVDSIMQGMDEVTEWNKFIQLFKLYIDNDYDIDTFFGMFNRFSQRFTKEFTDKPV